MDIARRASRDASARQILAQPRLFDRDRVGWTGLDGIMCCHIGTGSIGHSWRAPSTLVRVWSWKGVRPPRSQGMPGVGMPMSGMPGMTATPGMPTAMGGMGAGMVASGAMSPGGSVPGAAAPAGMEGQMPAAHSKTFEIPNDMVGKLIGKGGETLKRIQYMSGARIQVDHTNTTGESRQVTVSGQSQTSVDRAHQMALEIITPETTTDESVAEEIQCPQDMVGRVIGRQGETVRALQQVTKVQVRINQDFPEGVPRKIVITGAPERVAECRDWLNRLLSDSTNEPMQQLMQAAQVIGVRA